MTEKAARNWLVLSIIGTAILVVLQRANQGKWPEPKRFIALGIFYFVASMVSSVKPAIGGMFSVLLFVSQFLAAGEDAFSAIQRAVGKGKITIKKSPELDIQDIIPSVFPVASIPPQTGPGPCGKLIGTPGRGTHSSGTWENSNAIDIAAPRGTPITAPFPGVIGTSFGSSLIGGNRLHIHGSGANPRDSYFAHLSAFATGIHPGKRVNRGQIVGYVGDTGSARGTTPHLHFALPPPWNTNSMSGLVLQC